MVFLCIFKSSAFQRSGLRFRNGTAADDDIAVVYHGGLPFGNGLLRCIKNDLKGILVDLSYRRRCFLAALARHNGEPFRLFQHGNGDHIDILHQYFGSIQRFFRSENDGIADRIDL